MRIRFLTTIAGPQVTFRAGQVIDVDVPTSEMRAWLTPLPDGTRRAEVVRAMPLESATIDRDEPGGSRGHKRALKGAA